MAHRVTTVAVQVMRGKAPGLKTRVTTFAVQVMRSISTGAPGEEVSIPGATVEATGGTLQLIIDELVSMSGGGLTVTGGDLFIPAHVEIEVPAGGAIFSGGSLKIWEGVVISPEPAKILVTGAEPIVILEAGTHATQAGVIALAEIVPDARTSQTGVIAVAEPPPPPSRASQAAVYAMGEIQPGANASQLAWIVLGHQAKCVTSLCQIWKIKRRDGKIYRYTSLDRDLFFGGHTYKSCGSFDPSAADNTSKIGETGSQTLTGIISDDGITEAEVFGGLFDDAFVTSTLVSYEDPTFIPVRLASGWIGKVTQGRNYHTFEVLSVSARIDQQALVRVVSPTCSRVFGGLGCGVDVESMKLSGTVGRVLDRGRFFLNVPVADDDGRQWANGRLRFKTGKNAGVVREFKTVDFETGLIVLWSLPGLAPEIGDEIDILPGCDLTREGGCTAYNNRINFGGFPDVPGTDALLETPDAKL